MAMGIENSIELYEYDYQETNTRFKVTDNRNIQYQMNQ